MAAAKKTKPKLPIRIELTTPVDDFGKKITSVTITRAPCGRDMLVMAEREDESECAQGFALMASILGVTYDTILSMSMVDITAIQGALAPFTGD